MSEVERVKPRAVFVEEAIQLALDSRWQEALTVNRQLVERHGPDEDTYNRLGKALSELGEHQEALDAYQHALEINPLNIIAQKNRRRLEMVLSAGERIGGTSGAIDVDLFTEEPGKSALTVLTPTGRDVSVAVNPGDAVELDRKATTLTAHTTRGVSLGQVDTKIARRLAPLMSTGNRYSAAVARVDGERIEIMIREAYQAPENARKTSFPIARGTRREEFRPYAKESLLAAREADTDSGDEEEDEASASAAGGGDDEDLDGMQTVEGGLEEVASTYDEDDDGDEDARPEDQY